MKTYSKELKKKYSLETYKANKNCKSVEYKNIVYASKMQCMVLNNLEPKELEAYLNDKAND